MSELENATETVATDVIEAPASETQADDFDKDRALETIKKQRESEKRALAELSKAQKKLAQYEQAEQSRKDAAMSELEKAQARATELEAELNKTRLATMRRDAAIKHGLPLELADRLMGETPEDIEADAAKLAELLPKKQAINANPTNPNNAKQGETLQQQRVRLGMGKAVNIFDQGFIEGHGGGAFSNDKG